MMASRTISETRDNLLDKLDHVREREGYWIALCPAHEDHRPSLSIREHDDGVSAKCHKGCTTEEILTALGMTPADLRPHARVEVSPPSKESKHYYYNDAEGNPLFRVWRTPSKQFIQQRYEDGQWKNGLGETTPLLYRLPQILNAEGNAPVFVVEGEKDADRLAAEGLLATTSPMGAGKWRDEYARYLQGREVYVIPDNDKPGEKHAEAITRSVDAACIVRPEGLPPKGDVSDWLDSGHTVQELLEIARRVRADPGKVAAKNGQVHGLSTFTLRELIEKEFPPVKWIVPGVIPEGSMILAGKPKMGKSYLVLGLCISVATGTPALGHFEVEEGDVLYLALEDNERRLQARAVKILADVFPNDRLHITTAAGKLDKGLLEDLEEWLEIHPDARLVVMDTMAKVRPRSSDRRGIYEQDYEVGEGLTTLAGRYGVSIILVHHLNSQTDAKDPLDLISGSTGLTGGVDGAMVLNRTRSAADAVLKAVHRDLKDDPELALAWDSEREVWKYIGTAEEYKMGKERREILDVLANADGPMRPSEVAEILDKPTPTVNKTMQRMREDGYLTSHDYGKYEVNPHADVEPHSATVTTGGGVQPVQVVQPKPQDEVGLQTHPPRGVSTVQPQPQDELGHLDNLDRGTEDLRCKHDVVGGCYLCRKFEPEKWEGIE